MKKHRGIVWHKQMSKYRVQVTWRRPGRKPHNHLGWYRDPDEAAFVYDIAAWILHGVDAQFNFPDRMPPIDLELKTREIMKRLGLPAKPAKERTPP